MNETEMSKEYPWQKDGVCQKCWGEGIVADTDEQEPWSVWLNLPLGSVIAVIVGLVKPMDCPECGGSGEKEEV